MSDQEFLHGAIHGSLLTVISQPHRGYWALLAAAWIWAIWSCAEYWRGNPNYSGYGWIVPVLSLTYAARRLTLAKSENIARPTIGGSDLGSCFYWNCRGRGNFRTRICVRTSLASDHRHLGDRLRSHYSHAVRLLVGGRKKFAARGIVPDFVFPYCCSLAASFRAANNVGIDASGCRRNRRIIALVWNSGANRGRRNHTPHWCCRDNRSVSRDAFAA